MSKKENIIDAAIDVFSDKGMEKATISDIVQKAGIAQGTFYLYFPTKLAVMPAIAEVLALKLLNRLEDEITKGPVDKQLKELIQIVFSHTDEYKELTKIVYTGLTQSPYLGDWEEIYNPIYDWIEKMLLEAKEEQSVRSDLNMHYVAKVLIGMIESAAEQIYLFDDKEEKDIIVHSEELYKLVCGSLGIF